jgi:phytanoyl-CoA dioxygenase PhyH
VTSHVDEPAGGGLQGFRDEGIVLLGQAVDEGRCARLLADIVSTRPFGADLFLSEDEFRANPQRRGVNPRPGRANVVDRFDLSFITESPAITRCLDALCGPGRQTLLVKAVCGAPLAWLPAYVRDDIREAPAAMLGPYIRPAHRDITYFHGIDYHQDIIDYPGRPSDIVTLYVYLAEVTHEDSPLFLLPGSHRFGATVFPHSLVAGASAPDTLIYSDARGRSMELRPRMLTGPAGSAALWHACVLHGTQPVAESHARISIRYVIEKDASVRTVLDSVNDRVDGPLALLATRVDQDQDARTIVRGNVINRSPRGETSTSDRET